MDPPPTPSFDPALLDMENMTADKWNALIYNRIVQQEDIFVGDIKKKVIEIVNICMNKSDTTLESIKQDLTSTINGSKFEFEHQKFIDGIVGSTYEYLCQFIIKNSMENIKRTQSALNCFPLTNNMNCSAIKSCCNENNLLQESSKLTQIQCLPKSNNNTTDSDKAIQSYIFNNKSENDTNSILMIERENVKNTTANKMETTTFHNHRQTLQINNLCVESPNDISYSNFHTESDNLSSFNSTMTIEDDAKTTEAIISLALKIQQTHFNFVDEFENDDINVSNPCTSNESQTTKCIIEQNGDQNTDPLKLEEEYKMHNSLKILESLVNIEHDKLEVQKTLTENEIQQPNIENKVKMQFKSSKKTNIRKKKSRKSQEHGHKKEEEEEWLPHEPKPKNHYSKNKRKIHKNRESKKNKKIKLQNSLNNLSSSNSNSSIEIQNNQSISLAMNGSLFSSSRKAPETIVSTVTNSKSSDTISSIQNQVAPSNLKDCSPTNELIQLPDNVESVPHIEKNNCHTVSVNNSNMLLMKTCAVASTSSYNENDFENSKNNPPSPSVSVMKTSDYKKIYEKDRKSLFSPDIIITKSVPLKSSKDLTNDLHIKKEYNLIEKKDDSNKKTKTKRQKVESNSKTSNKRKKSSQRNTIKVKIANNSSKMTHDLKSKTNNELISFEQKSSYVGENDKLKSLEVTRSDDKTNTDINKNKDSNTTDILDNKVSVNIDTAEPQLDSTDVLENKESKGKDSLEDENMPEWLRIKCVAYNIKPLYIVINPNVRY